MNVIHHADCLETLKTLSDNSIDLVYVDPPFNLGHDQKSARSGISYTDSRGDYIEWTKRWVTECHRVLKPTGTMYVHLNDVMVHKVRCFVMDEVFGEHNWLNTIIWSYDYGGRGKDRFPKKHDTILSYAKQLGEHVFNWDEVDRIPYMAPGLQKDKARAEAGKVPTSVWWMSIVGTQSHERNGYPTQKPVKLLERVVLASCPKDGVVLDLFAGSGTTGEAAHKHGRNFILADTSPWAIETMQERFKSVEIDWKL